MSITLKNIKWTAYAILLSTGLYLNYFHCVIDQYMRFTLRNDHIVVTFTTTPYRIHDMEPTIKSILKQNINVDAIYVAIPYIFKRDNLTYTIPEWLQKQRKIQIIRTEDYGPATKLLGVLKHVPLDPQTIIITVDDDITYPKNTIVRLAYEAKKFPHAAIGIAGVHPKYDDQGILVSNNIGGFKPASAPRAQATILQGFAGIAYRRIFFADDIFNIENAPRECINADDVYLSFYLARNNIPRQVLSNKYINKLMINYDNKIGLKPDALHKLTPSPSDKHRICIAYLKGLYPNVTF